LLEPEEELDMPFPDETYDLRIEVDAGHVTISDGEQAKMDRDLDTLRRLVHTFPAPELKVEVSNQNPSVFRVAASLRLAGRTLFAAGQMNTLHAAWDEAVHRLIHKVRAFKEQLGAIPTRQHMAEGTLHEVLPTMAADGEAVERAVRNMDYRAFRSAMDVYDEPLEKRIGRWIERYPQAGAQLGKGLLISEIVEEVFLNAFDQYNNRPQALRLGQWLENLIDPSLRTLFYDGDQERENVQMVETARQAGV
jgi:ribosome-associated translation inhibitor RaiA